jgi:hypothetical protein
MSKVIIYVSAHENAHRPEVVFDGGRTHSRVLPVKGFSEDTAYMEHELFEVDERDINVALEQLTRIHPSRDVGVYRLEKLAVRPPSDIVIRNVTKDGVLP